MVSKGKFIVASGPVIVYEGKLLLAKDTKDDFYKFIGGTVLEGESLEDACSRRSKEAVNADIEIIRPLSPHILYENPQTKEKMTIILIHYLARLKNLEELSPQGNTTDILWLSPEEILAGQSNVSPNVLALAQKEDLS